MPEFDPKILFSSQGMRLHLNLCLTAVNDLREKVSRGMPHCRELDRKRLSLARYLGDFKKIQVGIRGLETMRFEEKVVTCLFDFFDLLEDRIRRIEVGGKRFLKVFLSHPCFDPARFHWRNSIPSAEAEKELSGRLRGHLFSAEVWHNGVLAGNAVRVYGWEVLKTHRKDAATIKHSLELIYRK